MLDKLEGLVGSIEWESLSVQSRKSYMTAWIRFNDFLSVDWTDATPEDVVAWVYRLAQTDMTSTIETRVAGVSYFYRMFEIRQSLCQSQSESGLTCSTTQDREGESKKTCP